MGSSRIVMSIRSRIGPESRSPYRLTAIGAHVQAAPGVPAFPHGHGLAANTSWNLAGYVVWATDRANTIRPDSSGVRNASSARTLNSGASSRNNTPRCARETAPGRAIRDPPPTRAGTEAEWCGSEYGGLVTNPSSNDRPASEWIADTSKELW